MNSLPFLGSILLLLVMLLVMFILISTGITGFFGAPYMPTSRKTAKALLAFGDLKAGETVIDLGSGNGNILIVAARDFGARAIGYEINPFLRIWSRFRIKLAGVSDKVEILGGNVFNIKCPPADLVVLFLLDTAMARIGNKLSAEMRPGTRVVSKAFSAPTLNEWKRERRGNYFFYGYKI